MKVRVERLAGLHFINIADRARSGGTSVCRVPDGHNIQEFAAAFMFHEPLDPLRFVIDALKDNRVRRHSIARRNAPEYRRPLFFHEDQSPVVERPLLGRQHAVVFLINVHP